MGKIIITEKKTNPATPQPQASKDFRSSPSPGSFTFGSRDGLLLGLYYLAGRYDVWGLFSMVSALLFGVVIFSFFSGDEQRREKIMKSL